MIVAVTGLLREARIAESPGVKAIAGGGRRSLEAKLERALEGVSGLISFGIAGGLWPAFATGDCVVASEVASGGASYTPDPGWNARLRAHLPEAIFAPVAGAETVVFDKAKLVDKTGAAAVDMESHIVARVARRHGLPFAVLRVVSDPAGSRLPRAAAGALRDDGSVNVLAVFGGLLARPQDVPALMRTARESKKAFAALLRCRDFLGPRFLGPDLGELPLDMR